MADTPVKRIDTELFLTYNYNMANEVNERYSWDPQKRELNLQERGDKLHLITIFKVNKRIWRKHYEKNS